MTRVKQVGVVVESAASSSTPDNSVLKNKNLSQNGAASSQANGDVEMESGDVTETYELSDTEMADASSKKKAESKMKKKKLRSKPKTKKSLQPVKKSGRLRVEEALKRKRKYRHKPGVVALRNVRRYQRGGELLLPKAPVRRLIGEILQGLGFEWRMEKKAAIALQEAAEAVLVDTFKEAQFVACCSNEKNPRQTVTKDCMNVVKRIGCLKKLHFEEEGSGSA